MRGLPGKIHDRCHGQEVVRRALRTRWEGDTPGASERFCQHLMTMMVALESDGRDERADADEMIVGDWLTPKTVFKRD